MCLREGEKKKKALLGKARKRGERSQQEDKEGGQRMCSVLWKTGYAGKGRVALE